jgi:hypothetical protein
MNEGVHGKRGLRTGHAARWAFLPFEEYLVIAAFFWLGKRASTTYGFLKIAFDASLLAWPARTFNRATTLRRIAARCC